MNFENKKEQLLNVLHELKSLAHEAHIASLLPMLEAEVRKLEESHFHLVVVGQFKRGKTTFINAILGEPLLPTAVVPLTSVLTLVRYGVKKHVEVVFQDNKRAKITPDTLANYVTEPGNPNNEKKVHYVEIQYPSNFLHGGIVLVDTPGIGSLVLHNTITTYDFIPNIDSALFILSADLPITQMEYQFLDDLRKQVGRVFYILNKIDTLSPDELKEVMEYNLRILREQCSENEITLFPLSSRIALQARTDGNASVLQSSKLMELENAVWTFLEAEKGHVLTQTSEK